MSQRVSGYARKPDDLYETPDWVTEALVPYLRRQPPYTVLEPAAGGGQIVRVLEDSGFKVIAKDRSTGDDFFSLKATTARLIVTNPPYGQAEQFIVHSLALMKRRAGRVAMLLRCDYDHAITRSYLFDHPPFAHRLVLRKRIRWIANSTGSPSFNHAWFVWDWLHKGPATIGYSP